MNIQDRNLLRLEAWDLYEARRGELIACCTKLQKFRESMRVPVAKLLDDVLSLTEQEISAIPTRESFLAAFHEFRAALTAYEDAIDHARKFSWPIPPTDEPESLCRPRPRTNN
jgi:hypothetical protein